MKWELKLTSDASLRGISASLLKETVTHLNVHARTHSALHVICLRTTNPSGLIMYFLLRSYHPSARSPNRLTRHLYVLSLLYGSNLHSMLILGRLLKMPQINLFLFYIDYNHNGQFIFFSTRQRYLLIMQKYVRIAQLLFLLSEVLTSFIEMYFLVTHKFIFRNHPGVRPRSPLI